MIYYLDDFNVKIDLLFNLWRCLLSFLPPIENVTILGGDGNDTFNGGVGANNMIGGIGNDTYHLDNTGDRITENINQGTDTVRSNINYTLPNNVENLVLEGTANTNSGLALGTLASNRFRLDSYANTLGQRFLYDRTNGDLFYDVDGSNSSNAPVKFAVLNAGLDLTSANFQVI